MSICKFGFNCNRAECGFIHPQGRAMDYNAAYYCQYPPAANSYYPPNYPGVSVVPPYGTHGAHQVYGGIPQHHNYYQPEEQFDDSQYYYEPPYSPDLGQDAEEQFYAQYYDPEHDEEELYLDNYEQELNEKFGQFHELSADCECCGGYIYDCSCPTPTCFCAEMRAYDKDAWFPNSAKCSCCQGYIYRCSHPDCISQGQCTKCALSNQSSELTDPSSNPVPSDSTSQENSNSSKTQSKGNIGNARESRGEDREFFEELKDCSCCSGRIYECENTTCAGLGSCGCFYHYTSVIDDFSRLLQDLSNANFAKDILHLAISSSMLPTLTEVILNLFLSNQELAARSGEICQKLVQVYPFLHDDPDRANEFRMKFIKQCEQIESSSSANTKDSKSKENIFSLAVFLGTIAENKFLNRNIIKLVFGKWLASEDPVLLHGCALLLSTAPTHCKAKLDNFNNSLATLRSKLEQLQLIDSLDLLPKSVQKR